MSPSWWPASPSPSNRALSFRPRPEAARKTGLPAQSGFFSSLAISHRFAALAVQFVQHHLLSLMPNHRILVLYAHPAPHRSRINRRLANAARSIDGVLLHDLYETYP
ncbi:MAG TPA: hypothetical protein DDX04_15465, partial [Massilia sp.]|nr:hypothetical protein [Massilia sp.]